MAPAAAPAKSGLSFAQFGSLPPKPGSAPRGRPRKDGLPAGSAPQRQLVLPVSPPAGAGGAEPGAGAGQLVDGDQGPALDPALVERTCAAIFETVDKFGQRYVAGKAKEIGADPETAEKFGVAVAMPPEAKELMGKTAPLILQKHGWGNAASPEVAFCAGLGLWAAGLATTLARLEALAKERAREIAAAQKANTNEQRQAS